LSRSTLLERRIEALMTYLEFLRLIQGGEKATVDFKVKSDAFAQIGIDAKAELAKDICAMANNGNTRSYIVIGVSDDRKMFHSVTNQKLTDDNLQDFSRKAIYPPPKVRLVSQKWRNAASNHRQKNFVIIQIGPQPRQVFRLAQDFIDYKKTYVTAETRFGSVEARRRIWLHRKK
jgi:predicted HTH transcriptional regulator